MSAGRYAPSPSGDLHFGNLRTAVLAWVLARQSGRRFILRVEDIDSQRSSRESERRQMEDLARVGLDWDEVVFQRDRHAAYAAAVAQLPTYECYCSRKDIQAASGAPHVLPGCYPGTCRDLDEGERAARRAQLRAQGRVPALRLRAGVSSFSVCDALHGRFTGVVDDFVLRRGGQAPDWAYNLAVVVDDAAGGVDQVVRGDDLLSSAPRQAYLAQLLGHEAPVYVHVPLVLNAAGQRLAKRDGAVTLRRMLESMALSDVVGQLAASVGVPGVTDLSKVLNRFELRNLSRDPYIWPDGGCGVVA